MNKYYVKYTDPMKRYQKSEKYKSYRRGYEALYRDDNRLKHNLKSWKAGQKRHGKRITPMKEIDYVLRRLLGE
tara:strand:+ start:84 stop:302 length:219 start_codon:yes stop_codon:yes gene_type:complete